MEPHRICRTPMTKRTKLPRVQRTCEKHLWKPSQSLPIIVRGFYYIQKWPSRCGRAVIPYVNDEQADAATKDPHLKLLFRLLSFAVLAEGINAHHEPS